MATRKFNLIAISIVVTAVLSMGSMRAIGQVDASELKKFQGTWKLVSAEMDGKKVNEKQLKESMIIHTGEQAKLFTPHQHKDTIISNIVKLDPSKEPHEMQWVRVNGPNKGKQMTAIYRFDNPDQLQISFDPAMISTPKKFGTEAGSGHIWHTWKRVGK